ncbi:MAG: DUF3426 domain-containing protein [Xanthomonadales bacterium]|nr:zinc-ribbon domain-containing protein [Gammaproteobacteria bacterium]NNK51296.1 DUF3426 domain-containing protein [Xanthomonadales bacterium]
MYTRCPGCHTAHALNASLLAQGGGTYRCGKCQKVSNALDALFDEYPAAGDRPTAAGDLPVLGAPIDLDQAREARLNPEEAALTGDAESTTRPRARSVLVRVSWVILAIAIAIVVIFKWAEFQQQPLLDTPAVKSLMIRLGLREPPPATVFRDVDQIFLVSRELKSHPSQDDMLRLTATLVNRAGTAQPYPDLEIILLDARGGEVSRSRFAPSDYLAEGSSKNSGMTPQAYLPLILDLPDPGREAVGFELNFE